MNPARPFDVSRFPVSLVRLMAAARARAARLWQSGPFVPIGLVVAGIALVAVVSALRQGPGIGMPLLGREAGAGAGGAGMAEHSAGVYLRAGASADATGRTATLAAADAAARPGETAAAPPAAPNAPGAPAGSANSVAPQGLPPLASIDRMIVKTGTLNLQVADLVEAVQRVGGVVASIPGAYIAASSTTYRADATPGAGASTVAAPARPADPSIVPPRPIPGQPGQSASITIKVPADSFGDAMQRLRGLGTPLVENVSTQEVTEEFVDLEAQVRNLEATEQQYIRFLDRAQRIEEILPLQQRLTEVRAQIERLKGRMNLLQRRADVSTIDVTLILPSKLDPTRPGAEPRAIRTAREAFAQLGVVLLALLDVVIYVGVYALPLLPLLGIYYWWRRGRRPGPAAPPAPSPSGAA